MAGKKKDPKPRKPKAPKPSKADVKIEHFRQSMRCELSDEEILERSRRQSRLLSEKALKQEEIKGMTAHLKASVKQIDAEISKCTAEINDGACYREVECERRFIYRTGTVEELRMDTETKFFERPMSGPERQLPLPKAKPTPSQDETTKAPDSESNGAASESPPDGDDAPESADSSEEVDQAPGDAAE